MEQQPHNSGDDHERDIPELERLWLGEIDMTGVVRQDDALVDVIGDAIGEAEAEGGEVPEWGARTLARALANQLDDPHSGALHHFAVTGHADPEAVTRELTDLYQRTTDEQLREWVNWLGTYVIRMRDTADPAAPSESTAPPDNYPFRGSALDKVGYYLRHAFADADARREVISQADAQAVAFLLAPLLPSQSEMSRFAETGDAHRAHP